MEQKLDKSLFKKWWFWVIAFVALVMVIGSLGDSKEKAQVVNEVKDQPIQTTSENTTISVGENGYINAPSPKAIIALTEDGFKELTKIYLANDMNGVYEFLTSGKGFAVVKGTKILVIDTAVGSRKIRVLEGDTNNQTGWITKEWVSKTQ